MTCRRSTRGPDMEPQVETTLCVTGGRLDFEAISAALGLEPTSTCRAGELPAAVARAGLARDMWQHTIARERCMWPPSHIDRLQDAVGEGAARLRALLSEHVAKVAVLIDIQMEAMCNPFLGLTARNVAFLNSIGAELRMGWRIREPEEYTDPERVARDVRRRRELGDALWAWRRAGNA